MTAPDEERRRADLALYVARNVPRLLARREAAGAPFCWPGLLFPQAWFLYRKMYLWAALVSAGPMLMAYVPGLSYFDWAGSALGAFGLKFYFADAERAIARIRAATADEDEARALIARAGGVSLFGAAAGAAFGFSAFVLSLKAGAPAVLMLR